MSFADALRVWIRIAVHSFGGPAGQIDVTHRILVEEKGWLSEDRFRHALSYCMMLPGPEAMQLVTYAGWMLHGVPGGIVAGSLFILPGFLSILAIGLAYIHWSGAAALVAVFWGLKVAVLAIVARAAWRLAKRTARTGRHWIIAGWAFAALFFFGVPFPIVILATAAAGWLGRTPVTAHVPAAHPGKTVQTVFTWGSLWLAPVAGLWLFAPASIYAQLALFFATAATLTFGGAYAVLAYVSQRAVQDLGWLTAGQMLDGLALAETTPGPLIQVVQFVGMLAVEGTFAVIVAAVLVTWVTFMPSFLWIFAGAPHMERLQGNAHVRAALEGVAAGVVGVIANLAAWFALHVLWTDTRAVTYGPVQTLLPAGLDVAAVGLLAVSALLLRRNMYLALVVGAAAGLWLQTA